MSVEVDTSGRVYDDFNRLLLWHTHREGSDPDNELPDVSDRHQIGMIRPIRVDHTIFFTSGY
jgi:hypothetical protein